MAINRKHFRSTAEEARCGDMGTVITKSLSFVRSLSPTDIVSISEYRTSSIVGGTCSDDVLNITVYYKEDPCD